MTDKEPEPETVPDVEAEAVTEETPDVPMVDFSALEIAYLDGMIGIIVESRDTPPIRGVFCMKPADIDHLCESLQEARKLAVPAPILVVD